MIERSVKTQASGQEDNPFGLNWATDPVDGDPFFNWNWNASGTSVTPFGDSGDLNVLMSMLQAMKNNGGAGDNLPQILAMVFNIGKVDKNDPATLAFFKQYGGLFKQVMEAELLLRYAQSAGSPPNEAKAWQGLQSFITSLKNGPLAGISDSDPILGPIMSALNEYSAPSAEDDLKTDFWDMTTEPPTFQLYSSDQGGPSEDGQPINLMGPDGQEIFAEYVFKDVLYDNTFGEGAPYADATNGLFKEMFESIYGAAKGNPMLALILLMVLLGNMTDQRYHQELQGYAYSTNWLTKHQNELQKLLSEFNDPNFFGASNPNAEKNAKQWMSDLRRLYIDAEFNPYAGALKSNIEAAYTTIFGITPPNDPNNSLGSLFWQGDPNNQLGLDLRALQNKGVSGGSTVIPDQFQILTKQFTDRSQAIQTQVSATANNDNTVVNSLKTFLSSVTQLEQASNQAMAK